MPADALRPGDVWPHQRSFRELRNAFAEGSLSPLDVVSSALEHAAQVDATLNAFALIDPDRALAAAAASSERWHKGAPLSLIDANARAVVSRVDRRNLDANRRPVRCGKVPRRPARRARQVA